jgi:hypothetical protein
VLIGKGLSGDFRDHLRDASVRESPRKLDDQVAHRLRSFAAAKVHDSIEGMEAFGFVIDTVAKDPHPSEESRNPPGLTPLARTFGSGERLLVHRFDDSQVELPGCSSALSCDHSL